MATTRHSAASALEPDDPTLKYRISDVLESARLAGATQVTIRNADGVVTVRDDGEPIQDLTLILNPDGPWPHVVDDPHRKSLRTGLHSLSPRNVLIRSHGYKIEITRDAWNGAPIEGRRDPESAAFTCISFRDQKWSHGAVEPLAVFSGVQVTVDDVRCAQAAFVSGQAVPYPDLGCRIEVRKPHELDEWHRRAPLPQQGTHPPCETNCVLVNFHGKVVRSTLRIDGEPELCFLVDLVDDPPAPHALKPHRARLADNDATNRLTAALQLEVYRYLERRGHHHLTFREREQTSPMGVGLPEAEPQYVVGLPNVHPLFRPVPIVVPDGPALQRCCRVAICPGKEAGRACNGPLSPSETLNVHLLAALGECEPPFVPVRIPPGYEKYSWAQLPTVDRVDIDVGDTLFRTRIWQRDLMCVNHLVITARTSDGQEYSSPVCLGVVPRRRAFGFAARLDVCVTREAQQHVPIVNGG